MTNIKPSLNQKPTNRQPAQHILKSGQKVYLYDDTRYTGRLLRPVERTYPPLARSLAALKDTAPHNETSAGSLGWTVELDRGGYDSAIVSQITPINPQNIEFKFRNSL